MSSEERSKTAFRLESIDCPKTSFIHSDRSGCGQKSLVGEKGDRYKANYPNLIIIIIEVRLPQMLSLEKLYTNVAVS
jgi:hypothetical protein